jgi:hypothetical protein
MATIALAVVGGAIGAPFAGFTLGASVITGATIGMAIGGAVGGVIDNTFLFPAIFGRGGSQTYTGPRLDDIQAQTASEGSPQRFYVGPYNRGAGTIIWQNDWTTDPTKERLVEEEQGGGKGGGGGGGGSTTTKTYYYSVDLAISVCEAFGGISAIRRIWADSKIIYDDTGNRTYTATTYNRVSTGSTRPRGYIEFAGLDIIASEIVTASVTGRTMNVTGVGTMTINYATLIDANTVRVYFDDAQVNDSGGPVTFSFNPVVDSRTDGIRCYLGTQTSPDSYMQSVVEAQHGAGTCPAYRGTAYVVLQNLQLADFGNRIPSFNFLVEESKYCSVGDAITKLCTRIEDIALPVNTHEVRGSLFGFGVGEIGSLAQTIEPLLLAYNLACVEVNGVLHFFNRAKEDVVTIAAADLNTTDAGTTSVAGPMELSDTNERELPSEVRVQFIEPSSDFLQGVQSERRVNVDFKNVSTVELPLVMTARQARDVASRLLWSAWSERLQCSVTLPFKYPQIQETDLLTFTAEGETWTMRVDQADRGGINYIIKASGRIVEPSVYRAASLVDESEVIPPVGPYVPPVLSYHLLDLPALVSDHASEVGFYHSVAPETPGTGWKGAGGYTTNDGSTYSSLFSAPFRGSHGVTYNTNGFGVLPTATDAAYGQWDRTSSLDVQLDFGELSSNSEEYVVAGGNRLVVGSEIIGFRTATLLGTTAEGRKQYRLTQLLRGCLDTRDFMSGHTSGERVIVLSTTTIGWKSLNPSLRGASKSYKIVPTAGLVDDATAYSFTTNGRSMKPYGPAYVEGSHATGGSWFVTFRNRGTGQYRSLASYRPASVATNEVDIMNGGTVVRTLTGTESVEYTQANQITDFGSDQSSITVRVYELDADGNRGNKTEITL